MSGGSRMASSPRTYSARSAEVLTGSASASVSETLRPDSDEADLQRLGLQPRSTSRQASAQELCECAGSEGDALRSQELACELGGANLGFWDDSDTLCSSDDELLAGVEAGDDAAVLARTSVWLAHVLSVAQTAHEQGLVLPTAFLRHWLLALLDIEFAIGSWIVRLFETVSACRGCCMPLVAVHWRSALRRACFWRSLCVALDGTMLVGAGETVPPACVPHDGVAAGGVDVTNQSSELAAASAFVERVTSRLARRPLAPPPSVLSSWAPAELVSGALWPSTLFMLALMRRAQADVDLPASVPISLCRARVLSALPATDGEPPLVAFSEAPYSQADERSAWILAPGVAAVWLIAPERPSACRLPTGAGVHAASTVPVAAPAAVASALASTVPAATAAHVALSGGESPGCQVGGGDARVIGAAFGGLGDGACVHASSRSSSRSSTRSCSRSRSRSHSRCMASACAIQGALAPTVDPSDRVARAPRDSRRVAQAGLVKARAARPCAASGSRSDSGSGSGSDSDSRACTVSATGSGSGSGSRTGLCSGSRGARASASAQCPQVASAAAPRGSVHSVSSSCSSRTNGSCGPARGIGIGSGTGTGSDGSTAASPRSARSASASKRSGLVSGSRSDSGSRSGSAAASLHSNNSHRPASSESLVPTTSSIPLTSESAVDSGDDGDASAHSSECSGESLSGLPSGARMAGWTAVRGERVLVDRMAPELGALRVALARALVPIGPSFRLVLATELDDMTANAQVLESCRAAVAAASAGAASADTGVAAGADSGDVVATAAVSASALADARARAACLNAAASADAGASVELERDDESSALARALDALAGLWALGLRPMFRAHKWALVASPTLAMLEVLVAVARGLDRASELPAFVSVMVKGAAPLHEQSRVQLTGGPTRSRARATLVLELARERLAEASLLPGLPSRIEIGSRRAFFLSNEAKFVQRELGGQRALLARTQNVLLPNAQVSSPHCSIAFSPTEGIYFLHDSPHCCNGTMVDATELAPDARVALAVGAVVTLPPFGFPGPVEYVVRAVRGAGAPTAASKLRHGASLSPVSAAHAMAVALVDTTLVDACAAGQLGVSAELAASLAATSATLECSLDALVRALGCGAPETVARAHSVFTIIHTGAPLRGRSARELLARLAALWRDGKNASACAALAGALFAIGELAGARGLAAVLASAASA